MAKIIGYILALIGILAILLSFNLSRFSNLPFLANINKTYILIAGLALVILGIAFSMGKGKKQSAEEVPIYHGKKIVGYRKAK